MREASLNRFRAGGIARVAIAAALLALTCALGGCANNSAASNSFAMAGGPGPERPL